MLAILAIGSGGIALDAEAGSDMAEAVSAVASFGPHALRVTGKRRGCQVGMFSRW